MIIELADLFANADYDYEVNYNWKSDETFFRSSTPNIVQSLRAALSERLGMGWWRKVFVIRLLRVVNETQRKSTHVSSANLFL